jgi:hypothetical protein
MRAAARPDEGKVVMMLGEDEDEEEKEEKEQEIEDILWRVGRVGGRLVVREELVEF